MSNLPDPEDNSESQPAPSNTPPTDYYPPSRDTTDESTVWKGSISGEFNPKNIPRSKDK